MPYVEKNPAGLSDAVICTECVAWPKAAFSSSKKLMETINRICMAKITRTVTFDLLPALKKEQWKVRILE